MYKKATLGNDKGKKPPLNFIRCPEEIWNELSNEFNFTLDSCASDLNHKCDKYYTIETNGLIQDWTNEIVFCHPLFNGGINKWVEKASREKAKTIMLIPVYTHTEYFHKYIYNKPNVEIRFLRHKHLVNNEYVRGYKFNSETNVEPKLPYLRPMMVVIFNNLG